MAEIGDLTVAQQHTFVPWNKVKNEQRTYRYTLQCVQSYLCKLAIAVQQSTKRTFQFRL